MTDGPEGFKVSKYPNVATGKDVDLFTCTKCRPVWTTFDKDAAQAHTEAGVHYPELLKR